MSIQDTLGTLANNLRSASGNPYTKGIIRYSNPMLNLGTFPLPYTPNTLVRGGGE